MSDEPTQDASDEPTPDTPEPEASDEPQPDHAEAEAPAADPGDEELRRQIEEELRKVRVEDLLLQSVASIVNLTARRIAKEDERDLDQARLGIEAVRAVVDLLADEPQAQVRAALSELQMLYAREAKEGGSQPAQDEDKADPEKPEDSGEAARAEARSRLWTPPSA